MKVAAQCFLLGLSAAVTCGCTTTPTTVDNTQLVQAATQILSDSVYYTEIFSHCAALGGEIEIDAIDTQQNWLNANAKLIAAADSYYSQQQATNSFSYMGKTLAPDAIRLALDATSLARNELGLEQRSPANKQKTCSSRLTQIKTKHTTLNTTPLIATTQHELLKHLPLDTDVSSIPTLAGGIRTISPGKSYYTINRLHQPTCANAHTLSIDNNWPMEAYANFCGEKAMEVITCEWGKCETKKL